MRALSTDEIDDEVLSHAMEESRHALYFKKLAMRLGGSEFRVYSSETLLAEAAIKRYFHELDRGAESQLRTQDAGKKTVYRFVTWLIEERAIRLYALYDELLREARHPITLKPVINDEVQHLSDMKAAIQPKFSERPLLELEDRLFWETWSAIEIASRAVN